MKDVVIAMVVAGLAASSLPAAAADSDVPTTLGIETKAKRENRAKLHAKKKDSVKQRMTHGKPKSGLGEVSKAGTGTPPVTPSK